MHPDFAQAGNITSASAEMTSLMKLANMISEAAERVNRVTGQLSQVSVGLHGPRPEPVNEPPNKGQSADSIASRVSYLHEMLGRLERASDSIVR